MSCQSSSNREDMKLMVLYIVSIIFMLIFIFAITKPIYNYIKLPKYSIEHYTNSERYYPMVKDKYLQINDISGLIELWPKRFVSYCVYFNNATDAEVCLKQYHDQQNKKNYSIKEVRF